MPSKTLSFNPMVFRKTMARFWPLWAAYFAAWFMALPWTVLQYGQWDRETLATSVRWNVLAMAVQGGVIGCVIAGALSAMAVWSFLYNARSVSGAASLPIRREGMFLSVTAAGIVPFLGANVLVLLCALAAEAVKGAVDAVTLLQWFAVVSLILVFFYGFATFCAQLTGNILVLPAVYLVLNFTVFAVWSVVNSLCAVFVYGLRNSISFGGAAEFLSPAIAILRYAALEALYSNFVEAGGVTTRLTGYVFHGWGILAAYAVIGLVFAALGLLLYRRRRMETAGDVVAVNVLKPVFRYCMAFGAALLLGAFLNSIWGVPDTRLRGALTVLAYMLTGAFAGWVVAKMLIAKSFRVWKGGWTGLIITCAVLCVLLLCVENDLFGYERHVPDAGKVQSVSIQIQGDSAILKDRNNIEAATEIHRAIIRHKDRYEAMPGYSGYSGRYDTEGFQMVSFRVSYAMEDGSWLERGYRLIYDSNEPESCDDILALQNLSNTDEAIRVRKKTQFPFNAETIFTGSVTVTTLPTDGAKYFREVIDYYQGTQIKSVTSSYDWTFSPDELNELYSECIIPDINDGNLGRVWYITDQEYYDTVYDAIISIEAREPNPDARDVSLSQGTRPDAVAEPYLYDQFYTVPTKKAKRTAAWLEEHGVILHTEGEVAEYAQQYAPATATDIRAVG